MNAPAPTPPPPAAKLWLFRLVLGVVFPALLLLAVEGTLRLVGYGKSPHFLIPDREPGYLRTNPDYVGFFLPGSFDLRPLNFRIPAQKPPNTVRIVLLGESAAQGIPVPAFAFGPQLRAQLRARYPGKNIEIINTGVVAINSHVVYQIAQDVAPCAPDLFVVYLGNNEVVGPYGPGCAYLSDMWPCGLIRVSYWVRATRSGQLAGAVVAKLMALRRTPPTWGGMAMFVDHAVKGDDARLAAVYRNFETNLRDIVRVAGQAGAPVLLCTVVSNLQDSPPFLSLHRSDLAPAARTRWQQAFSAGLLAWRLGEQAEAEAALAEAWRLDPEYADTAYLLGALSAERGDPAVARKHFLLAQHWDALRFRPAPELNDIIRRVAGDTPGVALVDAARALGSDPASTGPISGRELFFEHVHFDWAGNQRLGQLLADGVAGLLPGAGGDARLALDAMGSAAALGYTPHERSAVLQRAALIMQNPPFTNQLTYARDQARLARDLSRAEATRQDATATRSAQTIVRAAIARDPANPDLAKLAQEIADDLGDTAEALAELRRAQQLQPASFALATDEAIKLARLGRFAEAETLLNATAATTSPEDRAKMAPAFADFFTRSRRFADGRAWFDEEVGRAPRALIVRLYRGVLLERAGDLPGAEADFRAVLTAEHGNGAALEALAALLASAGRADAVDEVSIAALQWQPRNQANALRVAAAWERKGRKEGAVDAYAAAVQAGPATTALYLRLATLLYGLGRRDESLVYLGQAGQLAREENDAEVSEGIRELVRRIRAESRPADRRDRGLPADSR